MYIIDRTFETTKNSIDWNSEVSENAEIISDIDYDKFDFGVSCGVNYQVTVNLKVLVNYTAGLIKRDNKINTSILDVGIGWKLK